MCLLSVCRVQVTDRKLREEAEEAARKELAVFEAEQRAALEKRRMGISLGVYGGAYGEPSPAVAP
jgi:hypothetical protein